MNCTPYKSVIPNVQPIVILREAACPDASEASVGKDLLFNSASPTLLVK